MVFYHSRGAKKKYERHGPIRASDKICCLLLKFLFIFIVTVQISFDEYLAYINFIFSQNAILCLRLYKLRHVEYSGLISLFGKPEDSKVSEGLCAPML